MEEKRILAFERPDLIKEWNFEKNSMICAPDEITVGSGKKVWWTCSKCHRDWQSVIKNRVKGNGCPYCAGKKVIQGKNDLESQFPKIAKEWDYEKNEGQLPRDFLYKSEKKAWWKCPICGFVWNARISSRTRKNSGCPQCGYKKSAETRLINKTQSDAKNNTITATKKSTKITNKKDIEKNNPNTRCLGDYPKLVCEYDFEKNNKNYEYKSILKNSGTELWWKCSKGHSWKMSLKKRISSKGCPYCNNELFLSGVNDVKTLYPEVAKDWDYSKNDIAPEDVFFKDGKIKIWWKCHTCGYEWHSFARIRCVLNHGCKKCSSKRAGIMNRKNQLIIGVNDLSTINPFLASEWNYTKNNEKPTDFLANSNAKVWWKCTQCGHEWMADISERNKGGGCPNCAKRSRTSYPEQAIYYYIRHIYPDAINSFKGLTNTTLELDVFIPLIKLGIEYDGIAWHKTKKNHDAEVKKYALCKEKGIKLLRIRENRKNSQKDTCDYLIFSDYRRRTDYKAIDDFINQLLVLIDKHIDVDSERDKNSILAQYLTVINANSFADLFPEKAKEWDYEKNKGILPNMFTAGSNEIVWWKCSKCGNSWPASIHNRGYGKTNCPKCSLAKRRKSSNDEKNITPKSKEIKNSLEIKYPEIAKEWDFEKNGELTPHRVSCNSRKIAWWKCLNCGNEYQCQIRNRCRSSGCPKCSSKNRAIKRNNTLKNKNGSLATKYPEIAKEWNYERNEGIFPENYTYGSEKKVWWKCSVCGYEWEATINNRTNNNRGCPVCRHQIPRKGVNDLLTVAPDMAKYYDKSKNIKAADEVFPYSTKDYFWICEQCGYEWKQSSIKFSRKKKCPKCGK